MIQRLRLVLRLILAAVFLYTAYTKLRQPWLVFALSIDAYRLLPEWGVLFVARTLPWLELAIGLLLLAGRWLTFSSATATILLGAFFIIMILAFSRGMGIDCGCFGLGEALTAKTLFRDGLLLASAVTLTVLAFKQPRAKLLDAR